MAIFISSNMRDALNRSLPVSFAALPITPRAATAVAGENSISRTLARASGETRANASAPAAKHSVCCHEGGAENIYEAST